MKLLLLGFGLGVGLGIVEELWRWVRRKNDPPIIKLTDEEIRRSARKMLHRETGL